MKKNIGLYSVENVYFKAAVERCEVKEDKLSILLQMGGGTYLDIQYNSASRWVRLKQQVGGSFHTVISDSIQYN